MIVRLDLKEGMKANIATWFWEAADPLYKKLNRFYDKMAEVLSIKDIKGGFWQGTSAIGAQKLEKRIDYGKLHEDRPQEGFPVYAVIKSTDLFVQVPIEMERDWPRTKEFMRDYVKKNWPSAIEETKEQLVAELYNTGGYTAGDECFNNDKASINLSTYTSPKLVFDGKPMFNIVGNERTNKALSTYYNSHMLNGVTFANVKTMYNRLVATNNKKENDQPFDNSQDLIVVCHPTQKLDWDKINTSENNPDNAMNDANTLRGAFKTILPNPYLTTATFSCIQRRAAGIKFWVGEPKFNFWEENNAPGLFASVILDYAICVSNWRFLQGNNAPTAA